MSGINSSYTTVAEQVITLNTNLVESIAKINSIFNTKNSSVNIKITDENGVLRSYNVPSINFLKSEIDRLSNNINSLYSINEAGATIQTANTNAFKKIITVDLNREPNKISTLNNITTFRKERNWIFDGLVNPMLAIELDLSDKVENNVRKVLSRRYIIDFSKDANGNLTNNGQSALNSYNTLFRGKNNIVLDEFERWHQTTPGVVNPNDPNIDEQVFDLDPNELLYNGVFNILKLEEDTLNRKLWYHINTLDYQVIQTGEIKQLALNDELIINSPISNTRYKVIEISTAQTAFRVRLQRVEGVQPIPVGIETLKIYSPILHKKTVKISIGFDERNVIFVKAMNDENHLVARDWSGGTAFWTNDLRLSSDDEDNGKLMETFYIEKVYDYGSVIHDLVAKKIPDNLAGTPPAPTLDINNFKVVQINEHLTNTPDANLIKTKHNQQKNLKSEIQQLNQAILNKTKEVKVSRFSSESEKKKSDNELTELQKKKDSKSKLHSGVINEILDLSKSVNIKKNPKFSLRGFWDMPEAIITRGSRPQEIVQFKIQYRYLSKDGKENKVETFKIAKPNGKPTNAAYSNWIEYKTDARKRKRNESTGVWTWEIENVSDADTPNINQLDISIQPDERVEFRIKSLSEVGWPEAPVESDWSNIITMEFPDDLKNVLGENDFVLKEASQEELKVRMENELQSKGLDDHLADSTTLNNKTFLHTSESILSGFKDSNGVALDLYEYLKSMEDRIKSLEEKIKRAKGELEVIVYRNNTEYVVKNGSELAFTVECEDYLETYQGTGVPTGRVYSNNIYTIKDFMVKFRNKSTDSILGLLSNRTYTQNSDVYNNLAPQTFWVNDRDELEFSTATGAVRTQLDNQFIWVVNYDKVGQTTVNKLSDNIANGFVANGSNTITGVLGSSEYSVGYSETSILNFIGNNNSLLDSSKWIDKTPSVSSTTKLLTTIHPVIKDLENLVENNADKVRSVNPGTNNDINVPINIYFKINALDFNAGSGANYKWVDLNGVDKTVKHIKKVKFFLENESENRPFTFSIKFTLNRNKVIVKKGGVPNVFAPGEIGG